MKAAEFLNKTLDAAFNKVIAEKHNEGRVAEEVPGSFDGMGQSQGFGLKDVGDLSIPF